MVPRVRWFRWFGGTALLLIPLSGPAAGQAEQRDAHELAEENRRCLECHGQEHIVELTPKERFQMVAPIPGRPAPDERQLAELAPARPELLIDIRGGYARSVHSQVACVACHTDCAVLPHPFRTRPARCEACHEDQVHEYQRSSHGRAVGDGSRLAATCASCHGTHDVLSHDDPDSSTYVLRQTLTCTRCHGNTKLTSEAGIRLPRAAEQYVDSVHGRGLLTGGLIVAPACVDCHGVHDIRPASDPGSPINKGSIAHTCGKCHTGVEAIYLKSVHGKLAAAGDERGPVCADCHSAHAILEPGGSEFKLLADDRCGECHEERLKHYRETFHGKAIALGHPDAATCYDCHGHHDIQPNDHPESRLSAENRLNTCRTCHPDAGGDFAGYLAHGDHADSENYPVLYWTFVLMTTIVLCTFGFFGVHTALWTTRSMVLLIRDPAAIRHAKVQAVQDDEEFVRFRPHERFLHALVIISFLILVATGMPLKFYYAGWAQYLVELLGGIEATARLHRFGAILTFLYFGLHLASLAKAFWRRRAEFRNPATGRFSPRRYLKIAFGPDMPMPNLDDVRDWWAHQKWFFGKGPRPQFDKWTYWEKFDYFAVFWGVAIIGCSGLVMWFPEFFTSFLPGWIINIALIVHSDEALLAAGFIFTFHFFNVHFRVEKFPIDSVIFSGRISKTEMLHERRRWYDRLKSAGKLDDLRHADEWSQWKRVIHPIGFLAFGIGLVLLAMILYATGLRLFGGL